MATETIEFFETSGLTLTFDVFPVGSDTASFSGVSATERTNSLGTYQGTVTGPTVGWYRINVKVSTVVVSSAFVYLTNTTRTAYALDYPQELITGQNVKADTVAVSGDSTAADNLESFADGTGYAGTNNTIPTVTTVTNRVTANTDQVAGSAAAATAQKNALLGIINGTSDNTGFTATATEMEASDITEATADHYNGRAIVFISGALLGQATRILDYALATGRGHFTFSSLTEAVPNGTSFVIV